MKQIKKNRKTHLLRLYRRKYNKLTFIKDIVIKITNEDKKNLISSVHTKEILTKLKECKAAKFQIIEIDANIETHLTGLITIDYGLISHKTRTA